MTPDEHQTLAAWWHPHYLAAAQLAYPDVCDSHNLAVGWKATRPDGTTHNGYYWPLVNGDHDLPVLHEAQAWNPTNRESCPRSDGDGLCLATTSVKEASSGGVPLGAATGHVLVYPADLARSNIDGKWRVPWCVDVDSFEPVALIRVGLVANLTGASLTGANLTRADLTRVNLTGANLTWASLTGANLTRADLTRANLTGANLTGASLYRANLTEASLARADLTRANLYGADLRGASYSVATVFPSGFDTATDGMVVL